MCAPVNRNALANPKVKVHLGDAREFMLTAPGRYDLISSEPSNPYRAGVANLFTLEFYQAAAARLRPGGIFVQWVQAYEVDAEAISTIYTTLRAVFPSVETWQTQYGDLAFLAALHPFVHDVPVLRRKVAEEPFRSALAWVWRVTDLEGVFARYLGNGGLADVIAMEGWPINTDDRTCLEFAFARTVGRRTRFDLDLLRRKARQYDWDLPQLAGGGLDWMAVADRRASVAVIDKLSGLEVEGGDQAFHNRVSAKEAFVKGDLEQALKCWRKQPQEAADLVELLLLAEGLADLGDDLALRYADSLRLWEAGEADAVAARYFWRKRQEEQAALLLGRCLDRWQRDPWALPDFIERTVGLVQIVGAQAGSSKIAEQLFKQLETPLAVYVADMDRTVARLEIALRLDREGSNHFTRDLVAEVEPNVPWTHQFLLVRARSYRAAGDPKLAAAAAHDLALFEQNQARAARQEGPAVPAGSERVYARETPPDQP
jgi:hypothetical protein